MNQNTFQPIGKRILARRIAAPTVTDGGIIIPGKAQGVTQEATVVSVGSVAHVAPGDTVLVPKYGGTEFDDLLVIDEAEVLAIITRP